ncbi:sugar transferase [Candidatus Peregrinibacteria bacterium]|nr:sugar transferase [Candidatus Peregrinibacteria bacterium]
MKKSKLFFEILRLPVDFLATIAAFLVAYRIRPITDLIPGVQYHFFPEQLPPFDEFLKFALWATVFLIILFVFNGLYSIKSVERFGKTFLRIVFLVSAWLMFIIAYYFLIVHQLFFSRIALAHIWLFAIVFITLGRVVMLLIQELMYRFDIGRTKVLFIGVNSFADRCYSVLSQDKKYKVTGALAKEHESRKKGTLKIIGTVDQMKSIVHKYGVDEIIQSEPSFEGISNADILAFCRSHQIYYYFIPEVLRLQSVNIEMEMIDDVPVISLKQTPLEGWGHVYKRIFDILFSLILIQLLIPVWIIVPILIKLDSPGPAFYSSKRRYKNKVFRIFKFRSMVLNADAKKAELMAQNERKGPLFKIKDDPRVTRLGRFLRKTSIDELPQLFNVLVGTLSLVGPRPHLPEEVDQYKQDHHKVFAIKPGVTGLAQISGRSNLDFEDEVKLDFYYIENWSMLLDLKIIFKSIGVIFRADGH